MSPDPLLLPERYFVLGNPVAHSQSPFIHAEFARQTGQALVYEQRLCALDGFADTLRRLVADTDGGPVRGCSVTVPFKFDAFALASRQTPRAALALAANVLRFDADGWLADNTDGAGLMRDIESNAGVRLAARRVLLIGAGGAAAGVLGPLIACRPLHVTVVNRTADKAAALAARHADSAAQHRVRLDAGALANAGGAHDVVINATASSLAGAPMPVGPAVLAPGALVVDLMYGLPAEPCLAWARSHGATARDGLGMLVEQAAEAFLLWRGVRPLTAPVLNALRAKLQAP